MGVDDPEKGTVANLSTTVWLVSDTDQQCQ